MSAIKQLLANNSSIKLPTPPAIALRILEEVQKEEPSRIDTLDKAITRMGTILLTNIALSFVLVGNFAKTPDSDFNFEYFWKRSVTAAVGANIIAREICRSNDYIFIATLLHDIGILIADNCLPSYRAIFSSDNTDTSINEIELEHFGFSHAKLGSELLQQWGLPEQITIPIAWHQQPGNAPAEAECPARVINLSDNLSAVFHGKPAKSKLKIFRDELKQHYQLNDDKINSMIEEISEQSSEVLSYFDISNKLAKSATAILQEANEELSKLNLSTAQLKRQYKTEKEHAQQVSAKLTEANAELSRLAFQDSLTGLYNLRYFHDHFDRELQRASRYNTMFSLFMFDVDDFKVVNDTYGHQAGDKVLQEIANTTLRTMRNTDLVARYGGEEFAVILSETTLEVAGEIAERLRENISQLSVDWHGKTLSVTVSIGVSFYCPKQANLTKNQIIAIADAGLYRSKKKGKNCISLPL
ncbi:MAG: diguanylate cyclase [Deltaproteobacteria bacterium]|nr:diguanylate cyclase [Deltaproteobacteria bacterium]